MAPGLGRRTVVVTRAAGAHAEDGLARRLRWLGAEVRELPAIELVPPADAAPLREALQALDGFDWVVFASAAAVEQVLAAMAGLGLDPARLGARALAAVGPATAARLAERVRAPDLLPAEATGADLARALGDAVRGKRVLVPRPAGGRPELIDGLRAAGAAVDAVEAYRTLSAPPERIAPLAGWLERREVDAVAFASPSAVQAVVEGLGPRSPLLGQALLAAIGPTTAEALRRSGFAAGVLPSKHTGRDLADAIAERLGPG